MALRSALLWPSAALVIAQASRWFDHLRIYCRKWLALILQITQYAVDHG